jgi:hypothetical protein
MQVRIGVLGESLQQGAPGLFSGSEPDVHLRPAQSLLQGVLTAAHCVDTQRTGLAIFYGTASWTCG